MNTIKITTAAVTALDNGFLVGAICEDAEYLYHVARFTSMSQAAALRDRVKAAGEINPKHWQTAEQAREDARRVAYLDSIG